MTMNLYRQMIRGKHLVILYSGRRPGMPPTYKAAARMANYYNRKKCVKSPGFAVGDRVTVCVPKLDWTATDPTRIPCTITAVHGDKVKSYVIALLAARMVAAPVDKTTYTVLHSVTNHQHVPTVLSQVQPLSPSTVIRLNHECIQYTTEEVTIKFKHCLPVSPSHHVGLESPLSPSHRVVLEPPLSPSHHHQI